MISENNLLSKLNPQQKVVATHKYGPLLVLAGAGSGKTRSVIYRVAWLITHEKVDPWNILVVTFTNKAAQELRERLEIIFNHKIKSAWVGTFHSVCVRILRFEIEYLNPYTSNFTIFDRENQLSLLKKVYDILSIDKKEYPVDKICSIISKLKSNMILPQNYFEHKEKNRHTALFHSIYEKYNELLIKGNAMDFDDLLVNVVLLLQNKPDIKQKYQKIFQYIMIDEYQDTNHVQFRLIKLLSEEHQNICVVGDDDQAIYGWRGANVENILSFKDIFKNVLIVKLEQNYRSSQNILNTANRLIEKNQIRHKKELWTNLSNDHVPELLFHDNEQAEACYISDDIELKIENNVQPNEIVVLYRTNFQSRIFESVFASRGIPYQIIGNFSFFKRAEIKDMIAWLRFLTNANDMEACLRIINNPPRGIGTTSIDHLVRYSFVKEQSIIESLAHIDEINLLKPAAQKALKKFYEHVQYIKEQSKNLPLPDVVKLIIKESELLEYYRSIDRKEGTDKLENIQEFVTVAAEFDNDFTKEHDRIPNINDFLNNMSLQSDIDEYDNKKNTVKLMTVHCAKGLEFEYVYVAGLEEGILPHMLCFNNTAEIEEERRLLYVAITRAKKELKLNLAYTRRVGGKTQYQLPSRFLKDLDDSIVSSSSNYETNTKKENNMKQNYFRPVLESEKFFKIGQIVEHEEYGKGKILSVNGKGKDAILTVSFINGDLKKIDGRWLVYE